MCNTYPPVTFFENEEVGTERKFTCVDSCPIRNVISRFSGKWSMLVLCVLSENEATRFNAIGKAIPDISPKVLTDTLRNLENSGLVFRLARNIPSPALAAALCRTSPDLWHGHSKTTET